MNFRKYFFVSLFLFVVSILFISEVKAATVTWSGTSGNWETPASWSGGIVPGVNDDVTISSNVTVTINQQATIKSLIIGNVGGTATSTLSFNYDAAAGSPLIISGGDFALYSGATVTHTNPTQNTINGTVGISILSGDAYIFGNINANDKGFLPNYGPGKGASVACWNTGKAGSHGGVGYANTLTSTYDSLSNPILPGSGGGTGCFGNAGKGGGSIKIEASGEIEVLGQILANGQNAPISNQSGGAGSGGTVNLIAATISGSGTISAKGGNGYAAQTTAGSGGGGRISIKYSSAYTYSGTVTSQGGVAGTTGENGTLYIYNSNLDNLLISQSQTWRADPLVEGQTHTYNDVNITNSSVLTLRGYYTNDSDGIGFVFNVADFTLDSGSSIRTIGYAGASGPGKGTSKPAFQTAGGGSYGGDGGGDGLSPYGEAVNPYHLGSGGGGGYNGSGNYGGGSIRINATSSTEINGSINSSGYNSQGSPNPGGAGSGGTIYIFTQDFLGSGELIAHGGNSYNGGQSSGGAGGGGRVSIRLSGTNSWSGNELNPANAAASGTGGVVGTNGTVQVNQMSTGKITNAPAGVQTLLTNDWTTDLTNEVNARAGKVGTGFVDNSTSTKIAEMNLIFDGDLSFSNVSAEALGYKSIFHVSGGYASIAGYDSESPAYTLYVLKPWGSQRVGICPGVSVMGDLNPTCSGVYYLSESDENVSVVNDSGVSYWKVSGLTSTGGFSEWDGLIDNMSSLKVSEASNHEIQFTSNNGLSANGHTLTVTFDPSGQEFNLSSLAISDITLAANLEARNLAVSAAADTWGVEIDTANDVVTFTAPTSGSGYILGGDLITISFINEAINNPISVGTYDIDLVVTNTGSESNNLSVPIVDSDQVNVTAYVNTFINFDIDTAVSNDDCTYDGCAIHENGAAGANYTVDLGELNSTWVNKSNSNAVLHSDENSGVINSIWFDISTNAYNGAVVYVRSENGGLQGPSTNFITSVIEGEDIVANDGAYGFQLEQEGSGNGTITRNVNCIIESKYCSFLISNNEVFNTNSNPIDAGRLRMDVAAAASYTNNPGQYIDTLTFIAVPTY